MRPNREARIRGAEAILLGMITMAIFGFILRIDETIAISSHNDWIILGLICSILVGIAYYFVEAWRTRDD